MKKRLSSVLVSLLLTLSCVVSIFSLNASAATTSTGTIPDFVDFSFRIAGSETKSYQEKHKYCIAVNSMQNIVIVYGKAKDGSYTKPVKAMVCSCGENPIATLAGTWRTYAKYEWRDLVGNTHGQYATRIVGSILFHSVPYLEEDKSTLETEEYNKLGTNASAGCVRLSVKDAKWIYDKCAMGTIVTIYPGTDVTEPLKKPTAKKIPTTGVKSGWDPTDPDPANPWLK